MARDREAPKKISSELSSTSKSFQVKNGDLYEHFSIVIGDKQGNFINIEKLPPVLEPGYMAIENKVYEVNTQDLIRRRINVSREPITVPTSSGSTGTRAGSLSAVLDKGDTNNQQSVANSVSEFQINQTINMAWKNQIESIFHLEDPEADWEFLEDTPQPQQYNESSAA